MIVTDALNLVFPIRHQVVVKADPEKPDATIEVSEPTLWVTHTPISPEVFATCYRILAATKAAIFGKLIESAPRIATLALHDAALADAEEYGTKDADKSLLAEIRRLTMVIAPGPSGFDMLPIDLAIAKSIISKQEWSELESVLVFFTCGYAMANPSRQLLTGNFLASVLGGSMTSLPPTEYLASFATSTKAAPSTSAPSSPSSIAG